MTVRGGVRSGARGIVILDHLRWLAAILVAFSHVRNHLIVDFSDVQSPGIFARLFYFAAGYGHVAVLIFFVISGFLVGGKLLELLSSPDISTGWRHFLVDRFTRIFIVLWPSLLVAGALLLFIFTVAPHVSLVTESNWDSGWKDSFTSDLSVRKWLLNALLFNELVVPTVFTDGVLWSLAYEWTYYMLGLAVVLVIRRHWTVGSIAFLGYAGLLFVLALLNKPELLVAGGVWVMGILARIVSDRRLLKGTILWLACLALVSVVLVYARVHPLHDYVIGAPIALMLAHARWHDWRMLPGIGHWLSEFSYSLYTTHAPVIGFAMIIAQYMGGFPARMAFGVSSVGWVLALLLGTLVFSKLFAMVTEENTAKVRRQLWRLVSSGSR